MFLNYPYNFIIAADFALLLNILFSVKLKIKFKFYLYSLFEGKSGDTTKFITPAANA